MKFFRFATLLLIVVSALADCGCLKCGKNLRVVSKPNAPLTVIYRGELCHCPKPLPYRIEVPQEVQPTVCPAKNYDYSIRHVTIPKPAREPVLYKYGYNIEVPQVQQEEPCRYYLNLVAKPDRVVMPSPEGCVLPKPCGCPPIIEYLKNDHCVPPSYVRSKRDLIGSAKPIDWRWILQPKPIRSAHFPKRLKFVATQKAKGFPQTSSKCRFFRSPERPTTKIKTIGGSHQSRVESHPRRYQEREETANLLGSQKTFTTFAEKVTNARRKKRSPSLQVPSDRIPEQLGTRGEENPEDGSKGNPLKHFRVPLQTLKNQIEETSRSVEDLIHIDFTKNDLIYEKLLEVQNSKEVIAKEWRTVLSRPKYKDAKTRKDLLSKMEELLSKNEDVIERIAGHLIEGNFNAKNLFRILGRLQNLHCILEESIDLFKKIIKHETPVQLPRELSLLEQLNKIALVQKESGAELRRERERELKREVELLDNLRRRLESNINRNDSKEIGEVARIIWETNNLAKLQKETLLDLRERIQSRKKIGRELRIIFDLREQLKLCRSKLEAPFKEIDVQNLKLKTDE